MKLYIARHGRTNYNDLNFCNADPSVDVHLTDQGIEQAHALADKLQDISLDHIFISELRRTKQTADIVNESHQVEVEVEPLLNDHRSGFEGQSAMLLIEALDKAEDRWTARFNDGESIEDVKQRVREFVAHLKKQSYTSVLIVTSHWVVSAMLAVLKDIPNQEAWDIAVIQGDYITFDI